MHCEKPSQPYIRCIIGHINTFMPKKVRPWYQASSLRANQFLQKCKRPVQVWEWEIIAGFLQWRRCLVGAVTTSRRKEWSKAWRWRTHWSFGALYGHIDYSISPLHADRAGLLIPFHSRAHKQHTPHTWIQPKHISTASARFLHAPFLYVLH